VIVSLENKKAAFSEIKGKKISDSEVRAAIKKAGYHAAKIRRY
jgi:copper chaperone CopZ